MLYLEPAERFAFPKQTFYPLGPERERDIGVSARALVLLHPFVTQGTVPKQPGAGTRRVPLSGSSTEATHQHRITVLLKLLRVALDGVCEVFDGRLVLSGRGQAIPDS